MDEKPILPNDIISISIIEEIIYWLQRRGNKNIENYKVLSYNDDFKKKISPSKSWFFKIFYNKLLVLSISLKSGIKLNSYKIKESNKALKILKLTYSNECGNVTDYFN